MDVLSKVKYQPAKVVGGYTDRILRVNLDTAKMSIQELSPDFKKTYTGGRGYAIKLVWDETGADTRYDSPENILVMASGPLGNETGFPGTGKFIVGTISPLTDTFIDSNVGGHFGPLLKMAGFDAMSISGKARQEVIIIVDGDEKTITISLVPEYEAEISRGALSFGQRLLRDIGGGAYSDTIAMVTAGEGALHSRFGIINSLYYDRRRQRIRAKQAGRGGTGTVMRVKNVRGVVVRSAMPKINANNAFDRNLVRQSGAKLQQVVSEYDPKQLNLEAWGTTGLSEYMNKFHLFPINNYQYGQHAEASALFADKFFDKYFSKGMPDGCYYGCNLACTKGVEGVLLTRGPHAGMKISVDGPEYETVGAVSNMGIFDAQFVVEYNWYCDEYSLDTISTGVTIGFFMECIQRGFLTVQDIGYDLTFGNVAAADRLLHEIAKGDGFGKIAGQGVHRGKQWVAQQCAARTNRSTAAVLAEINEFAMEVKGLEFSMYVTKESLAQQGGYGFALKGPQHDEAWLIFIDQVNKEIPTLEQKAIALRWFPLIRTWFNATGLCKLPWIDVRNPDAHSTAEPAKNLPTLAYYVDYLNGTTGSRKSLDDILNDSERLQMLQKLINLRQGKGTRSSDRIPLRAMGPVYLNEYQSRADYYEDWLKSNVDEDKLPAAAEQRLELLQAKRVELFEQLSDLVYEKKGYTAEGIPRRETAKRLGLLDKITSNLLAKYGQ